MIPIAMQSGFFIFKTQEGDKKNEDCTQIR